MAWNKRGNTRGGASSGSGGTKRGGSGSNPVDAGTTAADCPTCQGKGETVAPNAERDEDGAYPGAQMTRCTSCNGTGKIGGNK